MSESVALTEPLYFGRTESEVRAAIAQAVPNVLRLALYEATRDPELAAMEVERKPYWGGAFFVSELAGRHVARVQEMAVDFILGGGQSGRKPSEGELRAMMDLLIGQPVSDFNYEVGRGDLVDDPFPLGVEWTQEPPAEARQAFHVVIIGAGLAGLSTAIQLDRLGIRYTIVERNPEVGGTWWVNDYPEARVDIASHHYQYSFMKNYPWRHYFATQEELLEYARTVADRFDLRRNLRLATLATSADWDEDSATWRIGIEGPGGGEETLVCNVVISAAGLFNSINMPDIPGIGEYRGKMFHTTAWDHGYDYSGKKVALIGVGSTGAQLMPALAAKAGHLTVYQRSPQWVSAIEGYRAEVSGEVQWLFDHFPNYWGWYSYFTFCINMGGDPEGLQNVDPEWQRAGGMISQRNDELRKHNIRYIQSKVGHRPELAEKLTPGFAPFAKRPVVDNGWFDALDRPNVDLVTAPIRRITADGIESEDGYRPFDLIVVGAGFKTERYLWPVAYRGRGGISLEDAWEKDGARAYLGISIPDFPNLFVIYGPNGQARSGGLIKWLEIWSRYALRMIVTMIEQGHRSASVRRDVHDDYNRRMDEAMKLCVWGQEGSESYYINSHGRSAVNMPWKPAEFYAWVREPDLDDYDVR